MEWEPTDRDDWVRDAERWIANINGVRQCKVDLDADGEVSGVHVVTGMEREPRHIVRDVESLLKARLGLTVYYKKIGVVQVMEDEAAAEPEPAPEPEPATVAAAPEPIQAARVVPELRAVSADEPLDAFVLEEELAPRVICTGVGVLASDQSLRAEVELTAGPAGARAVEEGPNHADGDLTLIGRAAVAAIRSLIEDPVLLNLAEVRLERMAGQNLVMAAVEVVEGRRSERLFGTCPAHHNRHQAVVYAVLDAMNRRLSMMALKSEGEED